MGSPVPHSSPSWGLRRRNNKIAVFVVILKMLLKQQLWILFFVVHFLLFFLFSEGVIVTDFIRFEFRFYAHWMIFNFYCSIGSLNCCCCCCWYFCIKGCLIVPANKRSSGPGRFHFPAKLDGWCWRWCYSVWLEWQCASSSLDSDLQLQLGCQCCIYWMAQQQ